MIMPQKRGRCVLASALALIMLPGLVQGRIDRLLNITDWQEITFDGKTSNQFHQAPGGGIQVESRQSVSVLQRPLMVDLADQPILRWRWRVDRAAPASDLSVKGGDDRSLAIYVAFPFVPTEANLFERLKRSMVETIAGKDAPGRILCYVWGGEGARGDLVPSPYYGSAGMQKILRPAGSPTGEWFEEEVDIAADYRATFGDDPPNPLNIAISADSDDTGTVIAATVVDLAFQSP